MAYPEWFDEIIVDPKTGKKLSKTNSGYSSDDGKNYIIKDGILIAVYPGVLTGQDEKMNKMYEYMAPFYDFSERFFGKLITGVDMVAGREDIVDRLGLSEGIRLLEVSLGSGVFQKFLRKKM